MIKPLKDIKISFDLNVTELSSSVKYFFKQKIDWDVFLPTKGINLQRPYVWDIFQKRELIMSILIGRHIPHVSVIGMVDKNDTTSDIIQIIDGKQRLSSIYDFINDKFTLELEDEEYLFSQLPVEYRNAITNYHFRYYLILEPWGTPITDEQKIKWFKLINFSGTPQDIDHIKKMD